MSSTTSDMERSIARCRVFLSAVAMLTVYVDPTEPTLTRWLPVSGGLFVLSRYWVTVFLAHLVYSVSVLALERRPQIGRERLTRVATVGDIIFAALIALVTEGTTSPFYAFFVFAVVAAGVRWGLRSAIVVTVCSVGLYTIVIVTSAPVELVASLGMRGVYIAIVGYLVGFLGQQRINQEERIRNLESAAQRERIARSLHDGYAQALAGVNLRLETCLELFRRARQDDALTELRELQAGVRHEYDELRAYIRSLINLRATTGREREVNPPYVLMTSDFQGSATLVEHVLLIFLEGTRNVRRHASAQSALLAARSTEEGVIVTIDDDGVGFPDDAALPWSIVSRVAECGGHLTVEKNGRPGGHLRIHLPES